MLHALAVPDHLQRNAANVVAIGVEETGKHLMELAARLAGLDDLSTSDILDVGCGVRFVQTIVNRAIPIGSYTGIEVEEDVVAFLQEEVARHDDRFRFAHWQVYNEKYNPEGPRLAPETKLPIDGSYDLTWLFSVFTHLSEDDAAAMLKILRRHMRPTGKLFFSAFIDDDLDGFEDRVPSNPLLRAYFGKNTMTRLIEQAGWSIDYFGERSPDDYIVDHWLCSPSGGPSPG